MNINSKADWSKVYIQPTPTSYFQIVSKMQYGIPEYSLQYIRPILKKLHTKLKRPVNIVDLGASYGIISSLLLFDLKMEQLIDFFVEDDKIKQPTWEEIEKFYRAKKKVHPEYKFYLSDNSQPAMSFSERVQICEKSYCFDLSKEVLPLDFQKIVKKTDLFIATGSLGYIGDYFFRQIFSILSSQKRFPLFAFSIYRAFYPTAIEKVFKQYNYSLIKSNVILKKGRKFASELEQKNAIESLHQKNINTVGFEDEGFYAGEFYLCCPTTEEDRLSHWLTSAEND